MNNKGVTLIELLVVIVVIGIISAFAVPAVGGFIDSARQQAVYQDAIAVRNAAQWYCAQPDNTCLQDNGSDWAAKTDFNALDYGDIDQDMDSFDDGNYVTSNNYWIAYQRTDGSWRIRLEANGTNSGDWEWNDGQNDPVEEEATDANVDDND
jgi:type IV pilus assembly protein PilA